MARSLRHGNGSTSIGRRFAQWAWHTDHDDLVPTVVSCALPLVLLALLVAFHGSPWWAAGVLVLVPTLFVAVMRGGAKLRDANRSVEDIRTELSGESLANRTWRSGRRGE